MKFFFLFIAAFCSLFGLAQNDPEPNLSIETFQRPEVLQDFKLKPYKIIKKYNQGKLRFETDYDSVGNVIKTQSYTGDYIYIHEYKHKGKLRIFYKDSKITTLNEFPKDKKSESQVFKVNFDKNGKIIEGESGRISVDDVYRKLGNTYYDDKERPIKYTDVEGKSSTNFKYNRNNLITKEYVYEANNKVDKTILNFKYKRNLVVYSETIKEKYVDGKLIDKQTSLTTTINYKRNLPVKKVFKNRETTEERIYEYDENDNMTYYSVKKYLNADNSLQSEEWYKYVYENNLKVYSHAYDGDSTHPDGKETIATYEYENGLLHKVYSTFNIEKDRKLEVEYFYNQHKHMIKKVHTILDINSTSIEEYKVEYF